jgi:hypothetical protein
MSEQFSKLNKLSHSLASKRPIELNKNVNQKTAFIDDTKPKFMLDKHEISNTMHKYNNNSNNSSNSECEEIINILPIQTEHPTVFYCDKKLMESYTPSIGIIMGMQKNDVDEMGKEVVADGQSDPSVSSLENQESNYKVK